MMTSRRNFIKNTTLGITALSTAPAWSYFLDTINSDIYQTKRPLVNQRNFTSTAVEKTIQRLTSKIEDKKLSWMFENCFPNTLDTTVEFEVQNNIPDTFVITGDIHAMWLRDSSAQVWPYLPLTKEDASLQKLIAGVIHRQTKCILIDPYANAFNKKPIYNGDWKDDLTDMHPMLHERKYEIDSLCYPIRLAYNYWKTTGDTSVFNNKWQQAMRLVVKTFKEQQRKNNLGPYHFMRVTEAALDTVANSGYGRPINPVGLIVSTFRPSDDATTYGFLIPSNLFSIKSLRQLSEIANIVTKDGTFANECIELANEVEKAVKKYGIVTHPIYGKVYAFEVDGFGNSYMMDDANIPSLLALPYLDCISKGDEVYQNTRKLILSTNNPYFFKGTAAEGIGGPHVGYDMIWPMSIIMRAMTSTNDDEIRYCIKTLRNTDANTGFMHESFHKNNPKKFTRSWFAWANTLFGELILKLEKENKLDLLKQL